MTQPTPISFLPTPTPRYEQTYMARLVEHVRASLARCLSKDTANDGLLLQSSGGKVYRVTVSDAGALTVTYVSG